MKKSLKLLNEVSISQEMFGVQNLRPTVYIVYKYLCTFI